MSPSIELLLTHVAGFVLQLIVLSALPLVVYLVRRRTLRGFLAWIGLKAAPRRIVIAALVIAALFAAVKIPIVLDILAVEGSVSGDFLAFYQAHGWSPGLVAALLVVAWLKTALTEEIFFRGFVGERLMSWLGFRWGNVLQSLIFALVHVPLLLIVPASMRATAVALLIAVFVSAWIMGYLNHVKADGSIVPSICMHGLGNTLAYAAPILLALVMAH